MRLEVADVQTQLARAFDIAGPLSTGVLETVSPTIEVGPGAAVPFSNIPRNARFDSVVGDATHGGVYGLVNPTTSQDILVIDDLYIFLPVAAQVAVQWVLATVVEAGVLPTTPWVYTDGRQFNLAALSSPNRIFSAANLTAGSVATGINFGGIQIPALTLTRLPMPQLVLPINSGILFGPTTFALTWWGVIVGKTFESRQR